MTLGLVKTTSLANTGRQTEPEVQNFAAAPRWMCWWILLHNGLMQAYARSYGSMNELKSSGFISALTAGYSI